MGAKINVGDEVYILAGDEKGSWGIVEMIDEDGCYHVQHAGGGAALIFDRNEIRKPRKPIIAR
ncbi:KOW motif-containing protein [Microbispora sp. NPDC049125]|uniref:KOW motif-containing protein n=1 Tax=Microbispora sp. NPDC049125 TaxID=3154929 RepID=UPI003467D8FD